MADMRISELTTAAGLHDGDLFETSQTDSISSSGYASYKTSLSAIAAFIAKQVQYSGDLQTTSKTLIGAINEVFNAGTSVTVENVLPATETTKRVATITVDGVAKDINADDTVKVITDLKTPKNATITNGIAQFECIEENLVKGLKVTMNPIQDLHGYSNPWVGGAGKNKLQNTGSTITINGVTFTVNSDGTVLVNGTATGGDSRFTVGAYIAKAQSSQILNGLPDSITNSDIVLGYQGYGTVNTVTRELNINRSATTDWNNDVYITVKDGITANNLLFKPMIRLSTESDSSFAPYSNICPISGRTEASVTRTSGEDVETHTHQYSETIYGGTDDFVNGGATSTMGMVDLGTLTWTKQTSAVKPYFRTANEVENMKKNTSPIIKQGLLCSSYIEESWTNTVDRQGYNGTICEGWNNKSYIAIYDESKNDLTEAQFKTAMDGVQLCYELATPTAIETSAEDITTVAGTNIISGTEPISECKYTELATVDDLIKIIGGQ